MSGDRIDALAQRLFQAARDERPDAALRRRVSELGAGQAARSEAPPASGARGATPGGRSRARWLVAGAGLSAAAAMMWWLGERTMVSEPAVRISAEKRVPAPSAVRAPDAPVPSVAAPEPPLTPAESPPRAVPPPRPAVAAPKRAQPTPIAPATPPAEPARVPLAQQLELLKQARALLRSGQSGEALAVLDRYGALGGADLRDEAALLRIEALAAQGRGAEAAELARRFTSEHPDSPLAERARRLGGVR